MQPNRYLWAAVAVAVLTAPAIAQSKWAAGREAIRKARAKLREQADNDRAKRAERAKTTIDGLIAEYQAKPVPAGKDDLLALAKATERLDPDTARYLKEKIESLAASPLEGKEADAADRSWRVKLRSARRKLTARPLELLNKTIKAGAVDLSFDFLQEVLAFDPDSTSIRKGLGQGKVDGQWVSAFMARKIKSGLSWDPKIGWIRTKDKARYEKGEYYDFQRKKWTTLEEANDYHRDLKKPWVFQTQHIEMRGHADLHILVEAADRLERFYGQIFATYANFFAKGRSTDYKLILGMLEHKPLIINIYKDKPQYHQARPNAPTWSAGQYGSGQSYFFGRVSGVMYHEFTHHILSYFTGRNRGPAWLTEGIATYTQKVSYDKDGNLVLGAKPRRSKYALAELIKIDSGTRWVQNPQYAAAGALVWYCMEAENRTYRADFVDFLRDSYRGTTGGKKLWDYLGVSYAEFEKAYTTFQNGG